VVDTWSPQQPDSNTVRMDAIRAGMTAIYTHGGLKVLYTIGVDAFCNHWRRYGAHLLNIECTQALGHFLSAAEHIGDSKVISVGEQFTHDDLTGVFDMVTRTDRGLHIRQWAWDHLAEPREILEDPHLNLCAARIRESFPEIRTTLGFYRVRYQQETVIAADPDITTRIVEILTAERVTARLRMPAWRPEQLLSALPDIADPTGPLVDAEELD
jgi:hypothetical protein